MTSTEYYNATTQSTNTDTFYLHHCSDDSNPYPLSSLEVIVQASVQTSVDRQMMKITLDYCNTANCNAGNEGRSYFLYYCMFSYLACYKTVLVLQDRQKKLYPSIYIKIDQIAKEIKKYENKFSLISK